MKKSIPAEAQEVIGKYSRKEPSDLTAIAAITAASSVSGVVIGGVLDLLFLSGFGTVFFSTVAAMSSTPSLVYGYLRAQIALGKFKNEAGQNIKGDYETIATIATMKRYLSRKYEIAIQSGFSVNHHVDFLDAATEVEEDIKKLSPAFKLVANKKHPAPDQKLILTLAYAISEADCESCRLEDAIVTSRSRINTFRLAAEEKEAADKSPPPPKQKLKLTW